MPRKTPSDRFWAKIEKSEGCWEWRGYLNRWGYGNLLVSGKKIQAHRFAYEVQNGSIPEGMQIDHTCRNPACVRGDHLRIATHKQNQENKTGPQVNSSTGIRGVYPVSKSPGRYRAMATHNGKQHCAGEFTSLSEAAEAVRLLRLSLFTYNEADRKTA